MTKIFCGDLYYGDSSDRLKVESFVVRDGSVGFAVTSETNCGRFKTSGSAALTPSGMYKVTGLEAWHGDAKCSDKWGLAFEISPDDSGYLYVKGLLLEASNEYPFEGELELVSDC